MTVAYKFIHETFVSRVTLESAAICTFWWSILKARFSKLENPGVFAQQARRPVSIEFFIAYEFRSRALGLLMGTMFDAAFRRFAAAFERRADRVFLTGRRATLLPSEGLGRRARSLLLRGLAKHGESLAPPRRGGLAARPMSPYRQARIDPLQPARTRSSRESGQAPTGLPAAAPPRTGNSGNRDRRHRRAHARAAPVPPWPRAVSRLTAPWRASMSRGDAEHRLLCFVAVGDEAALEHIGGACEIRSRSPQPDRRCTIRRLQRCSLLVRQRASSERTAPASSKSGGPFSRSTAGARSRWQMPPSLRRGR